MLLLCPNRKPTSSGTEPNNISTKFISETIPLLPPSPSYEEATSTTTAATTSSLSSFGQLANALWNIPLRLINKDDRAHLRLSKEGKSLLLLYYILVEYGLNNTKYIRSQIQAESPSTTASALVNAVGNYAFALALLHTSKQYPDMSEGRLSTPVNKEEYAILLHVKGQIVEDLVQGDDGCEESRYMMQELVGFIADKPGFTIHAGVKHFDQGILGGYPFNRKIRDSMDTGELDGAKVQECWSLFKKVVLAERTTSGNLLPLPGFQIHAVAGQSHPGFQRNLW